MRFIDVKVRLPKAKLGDFLENLPVWSGQMIGYDLLAEAEPEEDEDDAPAKIRRGNSYKTMAYAPRPGTLTEKVHQKLAEETSLPDLYLAFPKVSKHTVDSALRRLIRFKLVVHPRHGYWRAR